LGWNDHYHLKQGDQRKWQGIQKRKNNKPNSSMWIQHRQSLAHPIRKITDRKSRVVLVKKVARSSTQGEKREFKQRVQT